MLCLTPAFPCVQNQTIAALACSPSWNLVALVCNPLSGAESESCGTRSFNANTCTWTRKSFLFFVYRIESRACSPSCTLVAQHPIIQCMHYGMPSNTCTCSLTSFLFFCMQNRNHILVLHSSTWSFRGVLFCVQDRGHATHT